MDYDDMMDFKYGEENPGYRREIGLTAGDLDDVDPEVAVLVAETYARDNAGRREGNLRTENAELREQIADLRQRLGEDPDYED